ncbi:MAG: tRNA (adenosine(37)-N6)-dimethylallyltransferase MiaA [Acidobacteriota bacterium]
MTKKRGKPLVVVGPTASGKTFLAMELARRLDGEIVNADALAVYRHLEIGTDKPSAEMRSEIPHHLVDILEPEEVFSAGEFARRARRALADIASRGRAAVVVGGSGFYIRALLEGLSPLPQRDDAARAELEERLEREGVEALYGELQRVDPSTAERLQPRDRQRVIRALEIHRSSGVTMSKWLARKPEEPPIEALRIGLTLPRSILYDRIADRVHRMVEKGWLTEIRDMLDQGIEPDAPAFQAIGYRQMLRYARGECPRHQAIDETIRATRHYAKRQLTWFRRQPGIHWISGLTLSDVLPDLLNDIQFKELGLK